LKALLGLAVLVAIGLSIWLHVSVHVMPKQTAQDFVENVRVNLDNLKQGRYATYAGPEGLPVYDFQLPENGIDPNFALVETRVPKMWDPPESRTLVWRVTFKESSLFQGRYREPQVFRLVMADSGVRLLPRYKVLEFFPWNYRRPRTR